MVELASEGDQRYQGARLTSQGELSLISGGEIAFEAAHDLEQQSRHKSSSFAWQSAKGRGMTDETLRQSQLIHQGELAIRAAEGISIEIAQIDQSTVSQTLDAMVAADPQLGWLKEMEQRGDIDWRQVKEIHDSFQYSQSGLSGPAALAVAIVTAYYTAGAVSGLVANGASTAAGTGTALAGAGWANVAATAALTGAASNAAVSAINNRGDLGAVFDDVTSSNALKGYASAAVIAGLGAYTDMWGRTTTESGNTLLTNLPERAKAYALNTAVRGLLTGANGSEDWVTVAGIG
ncbi:DUF637 domain-containing protein [Halotalea alkalilenta]|uniref:DUF637 domain-containing protein n=1 Tax=Halotalea alkalilenta TaxID=376489 RepID=A0A172YC51_9GAMM|nr:DUF637 domain-containing protein [Halotalea alkalilenta]ANF56696.1 hypothetical protein A5892_03800 [Halotalea alkalilenta]